MPQPIAPWPFKSRPLPPPLHHAVSVSAISSMKVAVRWVGMTTAR